MALVHEDDSVLAQPTPVVAQATISQKGSHGECKDLLQGASSTTATAASPATPTFVGAIAGVGCYVS